MLNRKPTSVVTMSKIRGAKPATVTGTAIDPSLAAITLVFAVMLGLLLVTASLVGHAAPGHSVCRFSEPSIHSAPPLGTRSVPNYAMRGQVI